MTKRWTALFLLSTLLSAPALATEGKLSLELNSLKPSAAGCRLAFVTTNGLATPIEQASFEIALFDTDGAIDRLVSLDFKALPVGKTRILQFELADLDCAKVSRVLVNDLTTCKGEGLDPALCLAALEVSSRAGLQFGL